MIRTSCCKNYICKFCILDLINQHKSHDISCPYCAKFPLRLQTVKESDNVRSYKDEAQIPQTDFFSPIKVGSTFQDLKRKLLERETKHQASNPENNIDIQNLEYEDEQDEQDEQDAAEENISGKVLFSQIEEQVSQEVPNPNVIQNTCESQIENKVQNSIKPQIIGQDSDIINSNQIAVNMQIAHPNVIPLEENINYNVQENAVFQIEEIISESPSPARVRGSGSDSDYGSPSEKERSISSSPISSLNTSPSSPRSYNTWVSNEDDLNSEVHLINNVEISTSKRVGPIKKVFNFIGTVICISN